MRKIALMITMMLFMVVAVFAQETNSTYWQREVDVNGSLITYYMCKTDAQFNNTFKYLVKEQLGIQYSFEEPNWNSIQNGWISKEGIRKNFPKYYRNIEGDSVLNWDNYKYCWCIQNINGMYFISLAKRVNDTVYVTFTVKYGYSQWAYTWEALTAFESCL